MNDDEPISANRIVFFDTETTGLAPTKGDRVIELAAVVYEEDREVRCFSTLINPDRPIPARATEIHGITDTMVRDAPLFSDLMNNLDTFFSDSILGAYNINFDIRFLQQEYSRAGGSFRSPGREIDVFKFVQLVYPGMSSYALGNVASSLSIPVGATHRALADARMTADVFFRLLREVDLPPYFSEVCRYLDDRLLKQNTDVNKYLRTIKRAISDKKKLWVSYWRKGTNAPSRRQLTPLQLVVAGGHHYLDAFCHLREETRRFQVKRFTRIDIDNSP